MYSRFARGLLCAALIFICGFAFARGRCDCTISQFTDLEDLRDMMVKIAVYNNGEQRKTEQELAAATGEKLADIHKKYSATGILNCNGMTGSAQVTVKNNVITTAAHMLWNDHSTCAGKQFSTPSQCEFVLRALDGQEQKIQVDSVVDTGFKCPALKDAGHDWVVLKLKSGATGVQPYAVEADPAKGLAAGAPVTFVASSVDFWRRDSAGRKIYPKHIERQCHIHTLIKSVWDPFPIGYKGDCGAAGYASGGSLLSEASGVPVLVGVYNGNEELNSMVMGPGKPNETGIPNKKDYNDSSWAESYSAVTGDFLRAIQSAQ